MRGLISHQQTLVIDQLEGDQGHLASQWLDRRKWRHLVVAPARPLKQHVIVGQERKTR